MIGSHSLDPTLGRPACAASCSADAGATIHDDIPSPGKPTRSGNSPRCLSLYIVPIMYPSRILRADKGPKPNLTGFDIGKFAAAAGQPRYDPWERAEAWRYTDNSRGGTASTAPSPASASRRLPLPAISPTSNSFSRTNTTATARSTTKVLDYNVDGAARNGRAC
ncbi:NADH-ubiquinone oxidoreductase B12 subunit family [Microdochium nivale]|nr:NADH-ubiquinone oxidoreductase B12 subunit family [Microdochium nivale]